jgi:hypothetical protein
MVVIHGRTVLQNVPDPEPIRDVEIRIVGIWLKMPSAYKTTSHEAANLIFITPPLFFDRSSKDTQLQRYNLSVLKDPGRTLLENVEPGSTSIYANSWQGLSKGDFVAIDLVDPERVELHAIETVPTGSQAQPGRLGLAIPLQRAHRVGTRLQKANGPNTSGAAHNLQRDARAGESCLFLNKLQNLQTARQISIRDKSSNPPEYHSIQLYRAKSNEQGYYRLPPLSRVAQLRIEVEQAPLMLTAPSTAQTDTITVSKANTLSPGQQLRVGPAGGQTETVKIRKVNQQTHVVELMTKLSSGKHTGDLVISFLPLTDFSPDYTVRENQLDFVFG